MPPERCFVAEDMVLVTIVWKDNQSLLGGDIWLVQHCSLLISAAHFYVICRHYV